MLNFWLRARIANVKGRQLHMVPHPRSHAELCKLKHCYPNKSPTDLPSWALWQKRRSLGGGQTEAWVWARVAMVEDLVHVWLRRDATRW